MPLCKDLPIVGALELSATVTAAAAAAAAIATTIRGRLAQAAEFEIRSTGLVGSGPEERSATAAYSHDSN